MKLITKEIIDDYANNHTDPYDEFFEALFCNKLKETLMEADDENRKDIFEIVSYCYNHIPADSWGSEERFKNWIWR
jgi:hypothetical protein